MEMDCYESGMKLSKLQDAESGTKKRINKILKQVTELQEKKPSTNKRTAKINMILDLVNQLKEEEESEEDEDDKLESIKKLEEEGKLELIKKLEEEKKKLELMKKSEEEMKLEEEKKLELIKKLEEEEKKLELMKKLEEEEKKLELMKKSEEEMKLEEEKKLESMKKVEANEMPKWMEMKLTEMLSHSSRPMYDRDSTIHSYTPQVVQKLQGYAQMAIDVFNQEQPIKYSVVDVVRSIRRLISGSVLDLTFTAKPDDGGDAVIFYANIRRRVGRPVKVTYVGIER